MWYDMVIDRTPRFKELPPLIIFITYNSQKVNLEQDASRDGPSLLITASHGSEASLSSRARIVVSSRHALTQ